MLNETELLAIVRFTGLSDIERVDYEKTVQGIAVPGRMNFCLDNVVIDAIEKTTDARKQILAILSIDQYFNPRSSRCRARFYHWGSGPHLIDQVARMPGNFVGFMRQQVGRIKGS